MQGTMYWVVFLVAVLHSGHQALGKEEIVNEQEFHALCRMINWAEKGLKHITLARQVTEEALKIGIKYLEVAGEENAAELAKTQEISCTYKREVGGRNCVLYKTFWEGAQKAVEKQVASRNNLGRKDALGERTVEVRKKAMEAADIYHEVEREIIDLKANNMEAELNKALYGVDDFGGEIKPRGERSRVCGQNLHSGIVVGGNSLAVDLLCLCAMHSSRNGMKVCCTDCTTGENSNEWNPQSDEAPRWEFLKEKCTGHNLNHHDTEERLRNAEEEFIKAVTKVDSQQRNRVMYKLGDKENSRMRSCGADINKQQGICVHYGSDNGSTLPWMKALQKVEKEMKVTLQDKQDKSAKLKRIEELSQEIEKLIKGDTGRRRQQERQKRSVNPENSVPENPTAPSDPTQSTTHTDEKKRSVRKPISTGNGASKSYGSEEDDSYEYECEGENSACSDSPAKPTVKNSKSAINCPLGLILLLV
uniref:Variant surface glycoprotein (VSG), putative n=1 Tax=Trypanosoma brucei brucei (strain 927/4 GUTat10.1) TaxID=185431 RepID=Q4FKV7_TRYB2|nr:variant surface glycoprotein (VSG), putative [Trypanosoma brucei brucei TREU927]